MLHIIQLRITIIQLLAFLAQVVEIDIVICAETKFVMFVARNNEPFSICDGFSSGQRHVSGQ